MQAKFLVHEEHDSVGVAVDAIEPGTETEGHVQTTGSTVKVTSTASVPYGHKIAVVDVPEGDPIVKYGERIGTATTSISAGDHVHTHNLKGDRWK